MADERKYLLKPYRYLVSGFVKCDRNPRAPSGARVPSTAKRPNIAFCKRFIRSNLRICTSEITQFYRTFLEDPHILNTKLRCFASMSCDDDGPVGQTGSESCPETGERRDDGATVVN